MDDNMLTDAELAEVTGGLDFLHVSSTDKYYRWSGSSSQDGQKFLCPNCGRPVHSGSMYRYYCDPCNESWYFESKLVPNFSSGLWKQISRVEYNSYSMPRSR